MTVKADKVRTCAILYTSDYTNKVENFLNNNDFQKLQKDPTDQYQKKHYQSTTTMQPDRQQKTDEISHTN